MIKEALQYLAELAENAAGPKTQEINGHVFAKEELVLVGSRDHCAHLECLTLQAVIDYLDANKDGLDLNTLTIQVVTPDSVYVRGPIDFDKFGDAQREQYIWARPIHNPTHKFGTPLDPENFVTYLQTHFADTAQRAELLKLVGTITTGGVNTFADDGVTQEVTTKTGAARMGNGVIKNPYVLAPLRSFPEIAPVQSPFILRAGARDDKLPSLTLHECDGGIWKVTAIQRIAEWLHQEIPAGPAIIS